MSNKKENLSEFYDNILKETEKESLKVGNETQQILKQSTKHAKRLITTNIIVIAILCLLFLMQLIGLAYNSGARINTISLLVFAVIIVSSVLSINFLKLYSVNISKSLINNDSNSLKHAVSSLNSYLRIKSIFFLIGFAVFLIAFALILGENYI